MTPVMRWPPGHAPPPGGSSGGLSRGAEQGVWPGGSLVSRRAPESLAHPEEGSASLAPTPGSQLVPWPSPTRRRPGASPCLPGRYSHGGPQTTPAPRPGPTGSDQRESATRAEAAHRAGQARGHGLDPSIGLPGAPPPRACSPRGPGASRVLRATGWGAAVPASGQSRLPPQTQAGPLPLAGVPRVAPLSPRLLSGQV